MGRIEMELPDEIFAAFSRTPYPGDDALTACSCDECRGEVARFRGAKWSRLNPVDFFDDGDGGCNANFLTAPSFHYFLPGRLLCALRDTPDRGRFLAYANSRVTYSDRSTDEERTGVESFLQRLSARQRSVTASVIQAVRDTTPHEPLTWNSAIRNLPEGRATALDSAAVARSVRELIRNLS